MIYISKNLKFLRSRTGYSQTDAADLAGVKRTTWNGYEQKNTPPSRKNQHKIAEFFGISEFDLVNKDISEKETGKPDKITGNGLVEDDAVPYMLAIEAQKQTIDTQAEQIRMQREKIESLEDEIQSLKHKLETHSSQK